MLRMPRWLATLLGLLLLVVVLSNPIRAGNATGNAVDSMVIFMRSFAAEVGPLPTAAGSAYAGGSTGGDGDWVYPTGGVASGDGTTAAANGGRALALGFPSLQAHATVTALASEATLPPSRPVQLHIPSIGVSTTRFVGLGLNSDGTLQIPQAADVVGWYRKAPTPGERGPAVVTAHVDWEHERGVFHDLRQLKPGDGVTVERADGIAAVFRVSRVEEYLKERFPTDDVYGSTDAAELRLITCGGRYDRGTQNYEANVVVFGHMVEVTDAGSG
jgi:sortase (surface protein transpeptidase)